MSGAPEDDPFDLARFVEAQAPVMETVLAELRAGSKRSHWMWFVFPQLEGLGRSVMAQRYAIADVGEARAYWAHPVLGPRLEDCVDAVVPHAIGGKTARQISGAPDDLKFRSCLTLFENATGGAGPFGPALEIFFAGQRDPATLNLL